MAKKPAKPVAMKLYSRVRRAGDDGGMRGTVIPPDVDPAEAVTVRWDHGKKQVVSIKDLQQAG